MLQIDDPAFSQSLLKAGPPWMPAGLTKDLSDEYLDIE